jgi:serine/threonine protein kinase
MKVGVGTKLANRYHIQKHRGGGTYGEVWKAWDEQMARDVAIKVLHAQKEGLERLRKEGIIGGGLSHKNIVNFFDFNPEEGFLVMEFIEGKSLEEMLIDRRKEGSWVTHEEAIEILKQCLEALEHAHEKQRVHGDIKPANILLKERTGEVKLTDFGVAKILGGGMTDDPSSPKGSVTYAAPEVIKGEKGAPDFQSDLFSLGMIAYLLLTTNHPFSDPAQLEDVPSRIASDTCKPFPPHEIDSSEPTKLEEVTLKLLEKDRGKRYKNSRQALTELLSEEPAMIACSQCGRKNPVGSKFCNECGEELFVAIEAKEGLSPIEEAFAKAHSLFQEGEVYDAIENLEAALDANPKVARGWSELGFMYNNIRKYEQAEEACTKAIELDPSLASAYQTRGFARSNLGRIGDSVSDFNVALEKTTEPRRKAQILYQRGYANMLAGKLDAACNDAREALKHNPDNEGARWLKSISCH